MYHRCVYIVHCKTEMVCFSTLLLSSNHVASYMLNFELGFRPNVVCNQHAFLLGFELFSHYIDAPDANKLILWEKHFMNNINILAEDPCGVSELGFSYMVMDDIIPGFYKIVISMLAR